MSDPTELTPQQKLAALQNESSNQGTVNAIATGGHVVSAAYVGEGVAGAYATGGWLAARCFMTRLVAPLAGAMAGAYIAEKIGADKGLLKVAELFGAEEQAQPGPQPAVVDDEIAHNHAFAGALTGLLVGIAVGAGVALMIGTGGLLAPLVIGAAAGFAGAAVSGAGAKMASITGHITSGSPDVFFEDKRVARVTDLVACDDHGDKQIIEGSETIFINDLPLTRIGHKIKCSAVVQQGCTTIFADQTSRLYGEPDAEFSPWQQFFLSAVEVLSFRSASREGGMLDDVLRELFGEPIDLATGDYAENRTDFEYASVLPLRLTRCYSGKLQVEGILGRKWICNWSQRLLYAEDGRTVLLEDAAGQRLVFLTPTTGIDSIHLKAPYYTLSGTGLEAKLFDSRSQQTLIFVRSEGDLRVGRLAAIEDRKGNRIDFVYSRNRLQRIVHSDGVAFEVATTPESYVLWMAMVGDDQALVQYSYDERGDLTSAKSLFKGQFHYDYNEHGWLTHWRDSGATKVWFEYDGGGRVIATRTPEGLYNDRFIYHPTERKTLYIDATGAQWELCFNSDRLVTRKQDPLGHVTQYTWDSLERKQTMTDAAGRVTSYQYDDVGKLTAEIDWVGRTTRYQYDKRGLLIEVQYPDELKSSRNYDVHGNLVKNTRPDGSSLGYTYDERGRLLSQTDPTGSRRTWEYGPQGRLVAAIDAEGQRTEVEQDVWRRPLQVKDAAGFSTHFEYQAGPDNPRAALSRVVHPDGGEEHFRYDPEGLLTGQTGAEGQLRRFEYGAFDLLRRVTDPEGHSLSLEYDSAARLTGLTNAMGDRWIYTYDAAGRLAIETDWAGRRTRYVRDGLGRLQQKLLPDGVEQHFLWDNRDRVAGVATATCRIEYEYDNADRLIRAATYYLPENDTDLETSSKPQSEVRLAYNRQGQLIREIQNGMPITYRYDEAGHCVSVITPTGETRLQFDPRGLLAGLDSNGHGLEFQRNALGLEVERQYKPRTPSIQTAFSLQQSYDNCGRLGEQQAGGHRWNSPDDTAFFASRELSRSYEWDKSGRLRGVEDNLRGKTDYRYDSRDQVISVLREQGLNGGAPSSGVPAQESYQYDALMNLASSNFRAHKYRHGQVEKAGNSTYRYDKRGRVVSKTTLKNGFRPQTWTYGWDDFDRLIEVRSERGRRWRYTYDAFGRRIQKQCLKPVKAGAVSRVTYLWQGAKISEEWRTATEDGSAVEIDRWHYKPATFHPIAKETLARTEIDPFALAESRFYPVVTDQVGTPRELFSADGDCVWQAEYTLWGETLGTSPGSGSSPTECSLRFQGQWEDEESGLHYNFHRYYDPEIGQYLSPDPIGLHGGTRSYGYVHNPMNWIDPLGLATCAERADAKGFPGIKDRPSRGVSFSESDYLYPVEEGQQNVVKVKLTGSRRADFKAANAAGNIKVAPGEEAPDGYVWHHVNDYDPNSGTSTMELVEDDAHLATLPHQGSVAQYESANGVTYKR